MSVKTVFTKIGHGIVDVFKSPVKLETALQEVITAEPQLKAGVITLVKDVEDLEGKVAACIPTAGASITLDLDAYESLKTLLADFKGFVPVAEKVYHDLQADFNTDQPEAVAETQTTK